MQRAPLSAAALTMEGTELCKQCLCWRLVMRCPATSERQEQPCHRTGCRGRNTAFRSSAFLSTTISKFPSTLLLLAISVVYHFAVPLSYCSKLATVTKPVARGPEVFEIGAGASHVARQPPHPFDVRKASKSLSHREASHATLLDNASQGRSDAGGSPSTLDNSSASKLVSFP